MTKSSNNSSKTPSIKEEKKTESLEEMMKREWSISKFTKLTFQKFNKKIYVDIRKYYKKENELQPTKKGIMINLNDFLDMANEIEDIKDAIYDLKKKIKE